MKDILRASYDRSADGYDARFRDLQAVKVRALVDAGGARLASALRAPEPALDLGCGTGLLVDLLGEAGAAPARPPVGLDLSAGMLAVARRRGLGCVQGDLERLPFRPRSFGLVLAFTALCIYPDAEDRALAEVARVLRPGGLLGLTVLTRSLPADLPGSLRAAGLAAFARFPCGQDEGFLCARR